MNLKLYKQNKRAMIIGLMSGSLSAVPLQAQENEDAVDMDEELEVIMVTSRKRGSESIQDIGGSIQAIGGESLASRVALGFDDYMRTVPGLSANNSGSSQTQITIRGASSTRLNHANPNVPSTASVYFDETNVTTSGFNPDAGLVDIDRVEVLRGPQGTLFGASSMTGAIRIIFNEPRTDETILKGRFSLYDTKNGSGSANGDMTLNLPLGDTFALRASAYSAYKGGYIDNIYPAQGVDEDYNDENVLGGRIKALWEINDNWTLRGSLIFHETHANGRPDEQRINDPIAGIGLQSIRNNTTSASILLPGETLSQFNVTKELQVSKIVPETFDDEMTVASIQLDGGLADLSLTAVTSYFEREFENTLDDTYRTRDWINVANENWYDIDGDGSGPFEPGTGVPGLIALGSDPLDPFQSVPVTQSVFNNDTEQERFAQEIRVASDYGGSFNFIAGLYYEDDSRDFKQDSILPGLDDWVVNFVSPGATTPFLFGQSEANNWFEGRYSFDTTQIALFGEASFEFGDFELIVGGRYFDYEQQGDVLFAGFIEFSGPEGDRLNGDDALIEETGFSPKIELVYKASEDVTLYTSASEGFRLGSVQQFISPGCTTELIELSVLQEDQTPDDIPTTIDSDTLWNYEIGVKSTLHDGATRLNVSAYQIDWEDARSQVFLSCGWILEGNFFDIESSGVEMNLSSQLTEDLSGYLNVGWNDAEIASVKRGAESLGKVGDPTPMAPEWTISSGIDYFISNLTERWDGFIRADISYTSEQYSNLGSGTELSTGNIVSRLEIPDSTVVNLFAGIIDEAWELTFFIRNLTDERVITGIDVDRRSPVVFSRARPRNMGVSIKFEF